MIFLLIVLVLRVLKRNLSTFSCAGLAMEKDGRSSAMSEGEGLDEEDDDGDDDEEGGAETEEQSGNESEMNEQEEDVSVDSPILAFFLKQNPSCNRTNLQEMLNIQP